MLILETSNSSTSAKATDNRKEVREATSEDMCNNYLKNGWGLLDIVPKEYWDKDRGITVRGIVYVMYHTVM